MDLTDSITPRSDQLNADDLMAGPRVVTITDVHRGSDEQPVDIVTAEYGRERPYKPSKSMRRVMVSAWGPDSSAYVGRRIKIYRDPTIRFGRDEVGGIRISHLSDIERPLVVALTVTRGKRVPYTVQPLPPEQPPSSRDWISETADAATLDEARAIWRDAEHAGALDDQLRSLLTARVADLQTQVAR